MEVLRVSEPIVLDCNVKVADSLEVEELVVGVELPLLVYLVLRHEEVSIEPLDTKLSE